MRSISDPGSSKVTLFAFVTSINAIASASPSSNASKHTCRFVARAYWLTCLISTFAFHKRLIAVS